MSALPFIVAALVAAPTIVALVLAYRAHLRRQAEREREEADRRAREAGEAGLCVLCGLRPHAPFSTLCRVCQLADIHRTRRLHGRRAAEDLARHYRGQRMMVERVTWLPTESRR